MDRQHRMTIIAVFICVVAAAVAIGSALWLRYAEMPPRLAAEEERADLIEVDKTNRQLALKRDGRVLRSYRVALGFAPNGNKEREGDGKTPEGEYVIDWRNPKSQFHLSLHVSYPDDRDRARAAAAGVDPGGDIMIHGQPNGLRSWFNRHNSRDWTVGCIAVRDREMREIWSLVADGTRIVIRP